MITSIYPGPPEVIDDLVGHVISSHRTGENRLMVNMITTLDGATSVGGTSSALGDGDDRRLFHALRASCDVVLVGAGTVRSEGYHPINLDPEVVEIRRRLGLRDAPRLAIVSQSLRLDPSTPVFSRPDEMPYIVTHGDAQLPRDLAARCEVIRTGDGSVDPARAVRSLSDHGHEVILCEGGPTLNGHLVRADLVDELNLTLSPLMVVGESNRLARGEAAIPVDFRLDRLMTGDRMLFVRYLRDRR